MYFPYPDKSSPKLQGAGAYHVAKTEAGVPMSDLGAYHTAKTSAPVPMAGLGQTPGYAPIRSPWFPQQTPYPYIRGPIYTRPVFKENSAKGNFVAYPIVRMPSLKGLGTDFSSATPESMCEVVKDHPSAQARCLKFNTEYLASDAVARSKMDAQMLEATSACKDVEQFGPWSQCFYGHLKPSWYENPVYLGGAIVGACVGMSLLVLTLRD